MARKVIRFTPDQMGYKDRGKMKWQGLMLSDHSEALRKMFVEENGRNIAAKPQQSITEISEMLAEAYLLKKPITIQANTLQNGTYLEDIRCIVSGTFEKQIFLTLKDGRIVHTTLENIRHIQFIQSEMWYQKK